MRNHLAKLLIEAAFEEILTDHVREVLQGDTLHERVSGLRVRVFPTYHVLIYLPVTFTTREEGVVVNNGEADSDVPQ